MGNAVVIMGVAGCGKSSLGTAVATTTGAVLIEGDDYHSAESRDKMRRGIPLTDADREGWLHALGAMLGNEPRRTVLTCSALKRAYRDKLRQAVPGLRFVFLEIAPEESRRRVEARAAEHFFSASLVESQFAALEVPTGEADVLTLDARLPLPQLAASAARWVAREDGR